MAKVKFGMMMTDARGKLGGQVFSKNRSGSYVRTKVTPSNPQTSFQSLVRALFGVISQQWSGLAESARLAWNGAVESWQSTDVFGDLRTPTGKNLFQRLNQQAQLAGFPAILQVPAKLQMVQGLITKAFYSIGTPELTFTGIYAGADARVVVFATPMLSAGTKFVKNDLRQIYTAVGSGYDAEEALNAYNDRFGEPAGNSNVYFGLKYVMPNGQASPMQVIKGVIAP